MSTGAGVSCSYERGTAGMLSVLECLRLGNGHRGHAVRNEGSTTREVGPLHRERSGGSMTS